MSYALDAYDKSVAHMEMIIWFDYSDDKLKEAFAEMLSTIRQTKAEPSKHDKPDVRLKRLAATRLYRVFGTVEKAQSYLLDQGFDNPYEDDGGWSRARKEVWQTLGVDAFPQGLTEQNKVA